MPGGFVCSASLKGGGQHRDPGGCGRPGTIRKLFSKAQRGFYATHAPDGLELDQLSSSGRSRSSS